MVEIAKAELDMAKVLIESMTKKFDIAAYHDEYQQRVREAITTKINGYEIVAADTSVPNNIINLMEALQKSVDIAKHKGTAYLNYVISTSRLNRNAFWMVNCSF